MSALSTITDNAWAQGHKTAQTGMRFAGDDVLGRLDAMSAAEIDALPFGVVKVTDDGTIQVYNRYESQLGGIASAQAVGQNFFTDIAPCTNNHLFAGTFKRGVAEKAMNLLFFYSFTYRMAPTPVKVHLFRRSGGANWILVKKV